MEYSNEDSEASLRVVQAALLYPPDIENLKKYILVCPSPLNPAENPPLFGNPNCDQDLEQKKPILFKAEFVRVAIESQRNPLYVPRIDDQGVPRRLEFGKFACIGLTAYGFLF